jgi:flagellar basal body-associated protein FliL
MAALGLLCILTLAGCRQGAHYRADLLRADSVMDARPDSAYGIVARLRPDSLDDANRALLCLLTTQAKWKTDRDISNDTSWYAAIRHFTEQEDYDRLAKCYYYKGVVCSQACVDVSALECYLNALQWIERTEDEPYKMRINSYIGKLFNNHDMSETGIPYLRESFNIAKEINDSTGMAHALLDMNIYYSSKSDYKTCLSNTWESFNLLGRDTLNPYYLSVANQLADAYLELKDYRKSLFYAKRSLPNSIFMNGIDNGPSYAAIAEIYYKLGYYDNARKYYRIASRSTFLSTQLVAYEGLYNIEKHQGNLERTLAFDRKYDSIRLCYDKFLKESQLATIQSQHQLSKVLVTSQKTETKWRWFSAICVLLTLAVALAIILYLRRRKARDMKHLRDIYSKMQADWQAEKSREMEQLQQEMEALRTNIGQPQEDAEKMKALQQRLSQLEADNGKLAEMVAHHKNLHTEIFSGRHDNALACLHKVNTHPKADMITKLDWTQLYLLIDAIDPTFRSTYEPEKGSPIHDFNMQCLRFLGVEVSNIAIVFNGITKASASKGIYRSKHRGRQ